MLSLRASCVLVSIVVGLGTAKILQGILAPELPRIAERCGSLSHLHFSGISDVDGLLCSLFLLFSDCLSSVPGRAAYAFIGSAALPVFLLMAAEGARFVHAVRWNPLTFLGSFFVLINMFGVSLVFPLLWLPLFLYVGRQPLVPDEDLYDDVRGVDLTVNEQMYVISLGIPRARLGFVRSVMLAITSLSVASVMLPHDSVEQAASIYLFNIIGLLIGVASTVYFATCADKEACEFPQYTTYRDSSTRLASMYLGIALFAAVMYWLSIAYLLVQFDWEIRAVLQAITDDWAAAFLYVDGVSLFAAVVVMLAYEDSSKAILACMLVWAIGPGAATAWLLAQREQEILMLGNAAAISATRNEERERVAKEKQVDVETLRLQPGKDVKKGSKGKQPSKGKKGAKED